MGNINTLFALNAGVCWHIMIG